MNAVMALLTSWHIQGSLVSPGSKHCAAIAAMIVANCSYVQVVQPCTQDGYTRVDVKCGCYDCYC